MINIRKYIDSSFPYLNRLLGLKFDNEYFNKEKNYFLTNLSLMKTDQLFLNKDDVFFNINFNKINLPPESLVACFINKINTELIKSQNKNIFSLTIAVPDFFTLEKRESLHRAIRICDIDNFHIINESSASKYINKYT